MCVDSVVEQPSPRVPVRTGNGGGEGDLEWPLVSVERVKGPVRRGGLFDGIAGSGTFRVLFFAHDV